MLTFETELKKFKHEILKNIACLGIKDRLIKEELIKIPGIIFQDDKPNYRDTVNKEKKVILDTVKILSSNITRDNSDEFQDISDSDQIIYVIDEACDRCPTKKYWVTNACRGCISHKCMEVCPAKCISRVDGSAYIDDSKCKECGMCKKACPYDAISVVGRPCKAVCPTGSISFSKDSEDKKAIIDESLCINCGNCMAVCPFGAIMDKSSIGQVARELSKGEKLYAIVAPAIGGQFGFKISMDQVKTAVKKIGFVTMKEVAEGADAVTAFESNEFVHRIKDGNKYMTSSCCPGFMKYIEIMFGSEVKNISSTVSPMIATARYIKSKDKDAKVVFIGPCTAKKMEALRGELKGDVDYVLTFEELYALLDAFNVDIEKCEKDVLDEGSIYGRGFAAGGGLTAAIENYIKDKNIDVDFKPVKVSGGAEVKKAMTMAKVLKIDGNFIEGMACMGGCIGGPGNLVSQLKGKPVMNKFNNESTKRSVLSNDTLEEYLKLNLERHCE